MHTLRSLSRLRLSDEAALRPRGVRERLVTVGLLALLVAGGCLGGCDKPAATTPEQRELTIAVGFEGSVADNLGRVLATRSETDIQGLRVRTRLTRGVDENLERLHAGTADLGFVDAEGAYVGYRQEQSGRFTGHSVRAVAVLYPTAVHIFAKRDLNIRSVEQLRGRSVVVGEREGYADRAMRLILDSYNLSYATVQPLFVDGPQAADAIRDGTAAAVVLYTSYRSRPVLEVTEAADLTLVSLSHSNIAQIQTTSERNHFVKTITIPRGTYRGQPEAALTMGDDILLLCRSNLDDSLVYALTKTLFDSVPSLVRVHPAAAGINVERGPTTSVPLHPGAARYYRERELPR
ncbi:MAG: TAXI family TRAP transporter solute-binding subunit [Vicinamibacterales bacterium]